MFISFVSVFLGTLGCSIKKLEAPYVFDWEYGIALHAMQGNRASFPREGDVSYDFSSCSKNLGYIRELQQGWPFETPPCSAKSGRKSQNRKCLLLETCHRHLQKGCSAPKILQHPCWKGPELPPPYITASWDLKGSS